MTNFLHRMLGAVAIAVVAIALLPGAAQAINQPTNGVFRTNCLYSNSKQVDPIVSFGVAKSDHIHDFYGNTGVDQFSTVASLLAAPGNCKDEPKNHTGYWVPTMYLNGKAMHAPKLSVYYSRFPGGARTETVPAGLQMVAGNHDATRPQPLDIVTWNCLATDGKAPDRSAPYNCAPYHSTVQATIRFPSCWNGTSLAPGSVVYAGAKQVCPAGFKHILPHIRETIETTIVNPLNSNGSMALTLSSGPYYTLHSDVFEAWADNQITLQLRANDVCSC